MDKKIIFMTSIPFMKQHITDMYITEIGEKYLTDMWDLSPLYECKDVVENIFSDVKKIQTIDEFEVALEKEVKAHEIVVITNILNAYLGRIIGNLQKWSIPIVCINKESFNTWLFEKGTFRYRKYFRRKAQLQALAIHFPLTRYILNMRQFGKYKYDYLLASQNYYKMQSHNFIKIHHIKYDEFLMASNATRTIEGKYLLFIDAGPSTHPAFINRINTLDHNNYLRRINNYFEFIEKETGLPIVISAHPKSKYNKDDFGGRNIYIGRTAELIHYSEGVLSHYSTSLVNAALEYKPIQIIYYQKMLKSSFRGSAIMGLEFADLTGADICDMESPHSIVFRVPDKKYDHFLEEHICSKQDKNKDNATLVCEAMNYIFKHKSSMRDV